jgi:Fe-S-cluster containining protein
MNSSSRFSYRCNQCARCCHEQVITLSPYDVIRIARAANISTGVAIARYTIRRGSILKFDETGSCAALRQATCTLHSGRPLACRLYPLGLERDSRGAERYLRLEPTSGSLGIYGNDGTVGDFLAEQGAETGLIINDRYARLLQVFRQRIGELCDFDIVEPREFWRVAVREAMAETNFDFNPIVEALFDPDSLGCRSESESEFIEHHLREIEERINSETDPKVLATAVVMLAVSLGYSPVEAVMTTSRSP